jgi:hypothetical protein
MQGDGVEPHWISGNLASSLIVMEYLDYSERIVKS